MRLFEHRDFQAICIDAARHVSLPEQFIEKDYYVTEALCTASTIHADHLVFKGGTSLSKGWHLLERFSDQRTMTGWWLGCSPTGPKCPIDSHYDPRRNRGACPHLPDSFSLVPTV